MSVLPVHYLSEINSVFVEMIRFISDSEDGRVLLPLLEVTEDL